VLKKYFPYKRLDHRQILLYGFHFSFIFIFCLAVIRDIFLGNLFNASVNFSAFAMTWVSYYLMDVKKHEKLATYLIIAIAIIPLYILIYFNHFGNLVIVYVLLIPIVVFFLLPFKPAFYVNILLYILLICMLYYISIVKPDDPIIHNTKALINIGFSSILVMFFGIFYHLAIESTLNNLVASNKQKDILLQEVHHRVKNNLNLTASMIGLQSLTTSEEVKTHLLKSKTRIESIAAVHEMLYKQESFEEILFYDYLVRLEVLLSKAYNGKEKYIMVLEVDKTISFPLNTMVQFGLLLNEMIANALRHAQVKEQLRIGISLEKVDDAIIFRFSDNGFIPKNEEEVMQNNGLGSKLIRLSTQQIDGELSIYYKDGLTYQIRIENV